MQDIARVDKSKRRLLCFLGASAGGFVTPVVFAKPNPAKGVRSVAFLNTHTGEKLKADFWVDGEYQSDVLSDIDRVLRDHRSDEVRKMDPALINLLHRLTKTLGSRKPVEVVSAYRSPATNAKLRSRSGAVAKNSYHTRGMAVDIRLPDRKLSDVYHAARSLDAGGVAFYQRSDFVHVDVGPARTWGAKPKA